MKNTIFIQHSVPQDGEGSTALMSAITWYHRHPSNNCIQPLLNANADLNLRNNQGSNKIESNTVDNEDLVLGKKADHAVGLKGLGLQNRLTLLS